MTRTSRPRAAALLAGIAAVAVLSGCGGQVRPGAAAYIGDQRISTDELERRTELGLADEMAREARGEDPAAFQRQLLSTLINREVLREAANSRGVSVSQGQVDARLAQLDAGAGGREALQQAAAAEGVAASELVPVVRDLVLSEALGEALVADVPPLPPEQLAQLYAENIDTFDTARIGVIVLPDEAAAAEVVTRLEQDRSAFAEIARTSSADPQTAAQGGQLGEVSRGDLPPELADAVFGAQPGALLTVPSPQAAFVVEVQERRTVSPQEAAPQLRRLALQDEVGARTQTALEETAQRLGVTVNPRFGQYDPAQAAQGAPVVQPVEAPGGVSSQAPAPGAAVVDPLLPPQG